MTDEPFSVKKYGARIAVSNALSPADPALADFLSGFGAKLDRAMNATSEERAEWARRAAVREAEDARRRAEDRAAATPVPLALPALLSKMNWTAEYAEHLVQPYCECGYDIDGWSYCQHAQDFGLAP